MKNRLTPLILFLALMAIPFAARAQGQGKVGLINFGATMGATAEGRKSLADLQKKYAPRRQELERLQQDIAGLQDQLSKGQSTLSDEEQRRISRDIEEKQKLLKRSGDDAQSDYTADTDESVRKIGQKMVGVIGDYAKRNGFILIIDDAQIPIYYADKDLDISADIVKQYDVKYPVADATPAPAKPATPKP